MATVQSSVCPTSMLPKLKATSIFQNWKFRIVLFLELKGIHEALLVKLKNKRKNEVLKKKDAEARLWIVESVDDELLDVIKKCKTAREMIKKLEALFQRKTVFTKYDLRKKLLTMKFKPSDDIQKHFQKFDELISDLKAIGCKLEDSEKVCHLLLTLPDEYKAIVTSLDNILSLSESENIVQFVKNYLRNSVRRTIEETDSNKENVPLVTFNMEDGTLEMESEQYQIDEPKILGDVDQQCSEYAPIDRITASACTVRCSSDTRLEADEQDQCPDSIKVVDEVTTPTADEEVDHLIDSDPPYNAERNPIAEDVDPLSDSHPHANNAERNTTAEGVDPLSDSHPHANNTERNTTAEEVDPLSASDSHAYNAERNTTGEEVDPLSDCDPHAYSAERNTTAEEVDPLSDSDPHAYSAERNTTAEEVDPLSDSDPHAYNAARKPTPEEIDPLSDSDPHPYNAERNPSPEEVDPSDIRPHGYNAERQDLLENNNIEQSATEPEPSGADCRDKNTDAAFNQELNLAELNGVSCSMSVGHGQVSTGLLSPDSAVPLKDESPEEMTDMFCCNVVLHDAANRLWCAYCGQWCLSDMELQRHKRMHVPTTQTFTVHQSSQSIETLTIGKTILSCQEPVTTDTRLDHQTNSDTSDNFNPKSSSHTNPQGSVANLTSTKFSTSQTHSVVNLTSTQFSNAHINPQKASVNNLTSTYFRTLLENPEVSVTNMTFDQSSSFRIYARTATVGNQNFNQSGNSHVSPQATFGNQTSNQSSNSSSNSQTPILTKLTSNQSNASHNLHGSVAIPNFNQSTYGTPLVNPQGSVPNITSTSAQFSTSHSNALATFANPTSSRPSTTQFSSQATVDNPTSGQSSTSHINPQPSVAILTFDQPSVSHINPQASVANLTSEQFPHLVNPKTRKSLKPQKIECRACSKLNKNKFGTKKCAKCAEVEAEAIKNKRPVCPICNKSFYRKRALDKHAVVHTGEKPFECNICKKRYTQEGTLKLHIRSAHTDIKPFACDQCGKRFAWQARVNKHVRFFHVEGKPLECSICYQRFKNKLYLDKHIAVHNQERLLNCDVCNKSFKTKKTLNYHKYIHTEEKDKNKYICHACGKSYLRYTTLLIHRSSCYEQKSTQKQFVCNDCGAIFNKKMTLIIHLACHSTEKPFKCKICKKSFARKLYLDRHNLTHGERKYSCTACGQRFFYKSTYNRHMKVPHTDIAGPRRDRPPRR